MGPAHAHLARGLAVNSTLLHLRVGHSRGYQNKELCQELQSALVQNTTLQQLNFCNLQAVEPPPHHWQRRQQPQLSMEDEFWCLNFLYHVLQSNCTLRHIQSRKTNLLELSEVQPFLQAQYHSAAPTNDPVAFTMFLFNEWLHAQWKQVQWWLLFNQSGARALIYPPQSASVTPPTLHAWQQALIQSCEQSPYALDFSFELLCANPTLVTTTRWEADPPFHPTLSLIRNPRYYLNLKRRDIVKCDRMRALLKE